MAAMPGFFKSGLHTGQRRSPHQHFRDGICLATLRAFTGAEIYRDKPELTLREVALRVGSNGQYVRAAVVLIEHGDQNLINRVLRQMFDPGRGGVGGAVGEVNERVRDGNAGNSGRSAASFDFEVAGLRYTATVVRFPDGRIGEVFLQNCKPGSQSDFNARDSAVAASLALQFGCPLETLRGAVLRNADGAAATPLGVALDIISKEGRKQ